MKALVESKTYLLWCFEAPVKQQTTYVGNSPTFVTYCILGRFRLVLIRKTWNNYKKSLLLYYNSFSNVFQHVLLMCNIVKNESIEKFNESLYQDYLIWKKTKCLKRGNITRPPLGQEDGTWVGSNRPTQKAEWFANHKGKSFQPNEEQGDDCFCWKS